MKYSGHRKLICELSKLSKCNAFNFLRYKTNTDASTLVYKFRPESVYATAINLPMHYNLGSLVYIFILTVHNIWILNRAQNLRQSIVIKTSFKTWVSRMGLGSFVNIIIFVMKYYFFRLFIFSVFSNLLNQNLHKC